MGERQRIVMTRQEFCDRMAQADPPRADDVNSDEIQERIRSRPDGLERELWAMFGYDPDNPPA